MAWKNRNDPFCTEQGVVQKQVNSGKVRLRVTPAGDTQPFYVRASDLFDVAELLDDYCDAVEDGHYNID